ncbi:MAG: hypothetical protein J2P55_04280, partial [Rhizobiales bacterium]|nr:hypothetical protein [Hyphomicrobiales bacterium]
LLSTADKLGAVPASQNFAYLRIRPPDQCVIYLDGYLALQGEVAARQVFYNGTEHAIEIQGVGETNILARSGAVSQTGEFKNQTLAAAAQSLAAPLGIGVMPFGLPATVPFERLSVQPGETIWEFIERAGRSIGAMYVDTPGGTLVLGDVTTPVATTDEVIEGVNIIEAREIIQTLVNYGLAAASSQAPGNDNRSMASAAQLFASATGAGIVSPGTIGHIINEIPGFTQQFMQLRAMHDRNIEDGNSIKVWVSLNGFQKPSGGLWWPLLQNVFIDSPMLLMQQYLRLTKVTFSQDNRGGTRSQLELSNLASTKADAPS